MKPRPDGKGNTIVRPPRYVPGSGWMRWDDGVRYKVTRRPIQKVKPKEKVNGRVRENT